MDYKRTIIFGILLLNGLFSSLYAQKKATIHWLNPAELKDKMNQAEKPVLVNVFTDWCRYCKFMDQQTWKHDSVVAFVNAHFYAVKLNAEYRDTYHWLDETYDYLPQYKVNRLAATLLEGRLSYPSTVFIPQKGPNEVIQGAFSAAELELILRYYGEQANEKTAPENFQKIFSPKWK